MKRLFTILFCLASILLTIYSKDYYWYNGKQQLLQKGSQRYIIYEDNGKETQNLKIIMGGNVLNSENPNLKWGIVDSEEKINASNVIYQTPSYFCLDSTKNIYLTNRFYVKLRQEEDSIILQNYAKRYGTEIEDRNKFSLWKILKCKPQVQQNALELANIFYESGKFEATEPEFINAIHPTCVNDAYFSSQWNLYNTGQHGISYEGIDINYCAAHNLTSGDTSVIIGVFDFGIDLTHPDLNLSPISYDVHTSSSPSQIYGSHGTACAGIISAKTDNYIGVAGIAPNCPIISISMDYSTPVCKLADGFDFAVDNGCSVINNSWECIYNSDLLNEAISNALENGRNGKGCIVTFSVGNTNSNNLTYPANLNPDIITVGAISPNGKRKIPYEFDNIDWGSNYGALLDVMAPGVFISTTDRVGSYGYTNTSYASTFWGTSAACPHVSAIAGLMLSVNPYLTMKEVSDIIEKTAQKVGDYEYTSHPNYPNGTWNDSVGYGLVDAYAAVKEAKSRYIQGPDYVCDTAKYYLIHPSQPGDTVLWTVNNGNYVYPHYSIIGADNQDTVYIKCERVTPVLSNSPNLQDNDASNDRQLLTVGQSVSVTISNGTSETYTKEFRDPIGAKPEVSVSNSSSSWNSGTFRTFTITNCTNVPDTALTWEVKNTTVFTNGNPNMTMYSNYTGRTLTYLASTPRNSTSLLQFTITNTLRECTPQYIVKSYVVHSLIFMHAYNEGNILHVTISEDESREASQQTTEDRAPQTLELWHNIYGCVRTQPVRSNHEQIDITGLTQGVYVLLLKENGEVIEQTKVNIY